MSYSSDLLILLTSEGFLMAGREMVVLVNGDGNEIGLADKEEVHGPDTPLHLAFSCYLFDARGRLLVTRRALSKRTWPGVWTNSFCGHPSPGEALEEAVRRRADQELRVSIRSLRCVLPQFRYRAVDAGGVVENEICPVFIARTREAVDPSPDEVADWAWVSVMDVTESVTRTPFAFSPWMREQLGLLHRVKAFTGVDV